MHKAVKHYQPNAFLRNFFRIKSPSKVMMLKPSKKTEKGLEQLSKALKTTQRSLNG